MDTFNWPARLPERFLRDLQRQIVNVYRLSASEAVLAADAARNLRSRAARIYHDSRARGWTNENREIVERYLDYEMCAQQSFERATRYEAAYTAVIDLAALEIDVRHPAVAPIAENYLQWWQMRWLREQRHIAQGFGWEMEFTRPKQDVGVGLDQDENLVESSSASDEPLYEFDCTDEDVEDDESDDDVSPLLGLYENYSVAEEPEDFEDELDEPETDEPALIPVPLEDLINESGQRPLFQTISADYLKPADLANASGAATHRIRSAIHDVFRWAEQNGIREEKKIRQEIDDQLKDAPLHEEPGYPHPFSRHSSGAGQFMRVLLEYEGASGEQNWSVIDEV